MRFPSPVVVATTNPAKVAELAEVLAAAERSLPGPVGSGDQVVELLTRPPWVPEVDETAADFEGNAILKAAAVSEATAMAAMADDSGLEVDHLGGDPGVRSARYAGTEPPDDAANLAKLIDALGELPEGHPGRLARFRCVVVLIVPDLPAVVGHGTVEGRITDVGRGSGGFGYDPVFVPGEGDGRTFAEMARWEKNAISHRARALWDLIDRLRSL